MVLSLPDEVNSWNSVIENHELVLVDFYADWCEPCKWLDKILDEIDSELMVGRVILKVDIEKYPSLKEEFNIRSVPVLLIIKNRKIVWRMNGFLSGDELLEKLSEFE